MLSFINQSVALVKEAPHNKMMNTLLESHCQKIGVAQNVLSRKVIFPRDMDQQDEHELGVPNDAKEDPIVPLDHNDKQPAVKDRPDHPASKKELICFFLFGVFNNFSYIIMLRYAYAIAN